jgi:hypothetical protein
MKRSNFHKTNNMGVSFSSTSFHAWMGQADLWDFQLEIIVYKYEEFSNNYNNPPPDKGIFFIFRETSYHVILASYWTFEQLRFISLGHTCLKGP